MPSIAAKPSRRSGAQVLRLRIGARLRDGFRFGGPARAVELAAVARDELAAAR